MSTVSTHVLDTSLGRPANGIPVTLERVADESGESLAQPVMIGGGTTDSNGRIAAVASPEALTAGTYRLRFDTVEYFTRTGRPLFYPEVFVVFTVGSAREHYHIPLLLSPFGYSTYRGS